MIKFLLVTLLVCSTLCGLTNNECLPRLTKNFKQFKTLLTNQITNQKIDSMTNILNELPETIGTCIGQKGENVYKQQLPPICIADLNKAAKIGLRLQNQKNNQLLFSKDLFLLERLYQNKIKKQCPLLTNVTLSDIKDAATCMQSSYRFSLIVQKLQGDIKKNDKKAVVSDIDKIITQLPAVLDVCGKHEWANQVRKYLPLNCVHAVEDLIVELAVVQHHYTHLQWLVKNYKNLQAYIAMVKMHCPIFY